MAVNNMKSGQNEAELVGYLSSLYKDFAENRRILEPEWERNIRAYSMTEGYDVKQKLGVGNKKNAKDKKDWRSKSVTDLTRVKTNAGKILVCDVLLVGGEIPMLIKENRMHGNLIEQIIGENTDSSADITAEKENDSTEFMKRLIKEQLAKANADVALQECVKSAAIYGEGISRIYTETFRNQVFTPSENGWAEQEVAIEGLKMRNVSVWHFFTDMEDRDIQNNLGIFERRMMSHADVIRTFSKDDPINIPGAVEELKRAIANSENESDGTGKDNEPPYMKAISKRKKTLEVLEFWGRVPRKYLDKYRDSTDESDIEVMAVLVENTLVRFAEVEKGNRPYVRISWENPTDDIRGTGIADACSPAQQSLDSVIRLIEDNKKITCNAAIATQDRFFVNKNDSGELFPGKQIRINSGCDDVRKAIQPIVFPDVGRGGFDLLQHYKESGAEASMIPEIAHGVSPSSANTAYEVSVRNEKAGKYISDVVRGIDDNWIEPVGRFFYRWNMLDPDVPDLFKGAFEIQAMGFASYNDRVLRMNALKEMLTLCLSNEMIGQMVNIKALLEEWMKTNDLDAERFIPGEQNAENPTVAMLQQLMQQLSAKFQQIDEQMSAIMKELPSLSQQSQLDAEKKTAEIQKLQAESQKILVQAQAEQQKQQTTRAKVIADIERLRDSEITR